MDAIPFIIVVCLVWFVVLQIKKGEDESRRIEKERARKKWEESPERMAILERERRDTEEKYRAEQERRKQRAEEQARVERERLESLARTEWQMFYKTKSLVEIEAMTGREFEEFLARLLAVMRYTNVTLTPMNDQGGDVVCECPKGKRTVVQAKRWKSRLGNKVVQEILGAILHYKSDAGMIVTNNGFTKSAIALAAKDPRITLCDGWWLRDQIQEYLPPEIPEFNREEYEKNVKGKVKYTVMMPGGLKSQLHRLKKTGRKRRSGFGKKKWRS